MPVLLYNGSSNPKGAKGTGYVPLLPLYKPDYQELDFNGALTVY